MKLLFINLKKVLRNIPSLLVGILLGGLLYWLFVSTTNFTLIQGNLGSMYVKLMILVYFLVSFFLGLLAATTMYKIIFSYKMNKRSGLGTVAAFFALLGAGCPACSITLAGYLGLNFILMSLPLYGLEIQILGLLVLVYAIYYNLKNLESCKVKLNNKK